MSLFTMVIRSCCGLTIETTLLDPSKLVRTGSQIPVHQKFGRTMSGLPSTARV